MEWEPKNKTISIRITNSLLKQIDDYIEKNYGKKKYWGKTRSEFIIECIERQIKH